MGFLTEDRACRAGLPESSVSGGPLLLVLERTDVLSSTLRPLCSQLGLRIERVSADVHPCVLACKGPIAIAAISGLDEDRILRIVAEYDPYLPVLLVGIDGTRTARSNVAERETLTAIRRVGRFPGIGDLADLIVMSRRSGRARYSESMAAETA